MSNNSNPLAITMGDPAGIGPEIVAKLVAKRGAEMPLVVLGEPAVMQRAIELVGLGLTLKQITHPNQAHAQPDIMHCLSASENSHLPAYGTLSAQNGQAAYDAIIAGIEFAKQSEVDAIVTAPIHKEAPAFARMGV